MRKALLISKNISFLQAKADEITHVYAKRYANLFPSRISKGNAKRYCNHICRKKLTYAFTENQFILPQTRDKWGKGF